MENRHLYSNLVEKQEGTSVLAQDQPVAPNDTELISTRIPRINPFIVSNQSGGTLNDEDAVEDEDKDEEEPTDDEGDPTGEHDHHQDDNYYLGGHVTRSSE